MPRKYVKKGGNGGRRPGAGRPKGGKNALPAGAVKAIKATRHRVPEGTAPELAQIADRALDVVVKVMDGKVRKGARERLSAAALVREEICGPVPKKVDVDGNVTVQVVNPFEVDDA